MIILTNETDQWPKKLSLLKNHDKDKREIWINISKTYKIDN